MLNQPKTAPMRLGQLMRPYNSVVAYPVIAIYFCADCWNAVLQVGPHKLAYSQHDLTPDNPKEYAFTKIYETKTGRALGLIQGGVR